MANKKSIFDVGNGIYYSADMFSDYDRLGLPAFDIQEFWDFQQKLIDSSPYLKDFPWLKTTKDTSNILPEVNTNVNTGTDSSWFSDLFSENGTLSPNTLKGLASIGQAAASLFGAYNSYKGFGLAEDQFNYAKAFANQNLANQKAAYNAALEDKLQARAAMMTGDMHANDDLIKERRLA